MNPENQKGTTQERLNNAAIHLLSLSWYSEVSVADICRQAGVSNGVFYRYYKNKEEIFRNLIEQYLTILKAEVEKIPPGSADQVLRNLVNSIFDLTHKEKELLSIFREGQYRFYEYERELQSIYRQTIRRTLLPGVTEAELLYITSGIRFAAFRSVFNEKPVNRDALINIILNGVFQDAAQDTDSIFNIEVTPLPIRLEENTRQRMLRVGRRLFGESGYHAVNIHQITSEAGVGVGTFYTYFETKETFFAEIIDIISHEVRSFLRKNLDTRLTRIEQELQGIYLFTFYLTLDPTCYNIVREGEFVVPWKVREYYNNFEKGYQRNLSGIKSEHAETVISFLLGLSHYTGLETLFDKSRVTAKEMVLQMVKFLHSGIEGKGSKA